MSTLVAWSDATFDAALQHLRGQFATVSDEEQILVSVGPPDAAFPDAEATQRVVPAPPSPGWNIRVVAGPADLATARRNSVASGFVSYSPSGSNVVQACLQRCPAERRQGAVVCFAYRDRLAKLEVDSDVELARDAADTLYVVTAAKTVTLEAAPAPLTAKGDVARQKAARPQVPSRQLDSASNRSPSSGVVLQLTFNPPVCMLAGRNLEEFREYIQRALLDVAADHLSKAKVREAPQFRAVTSSSALPVEELSFPMLFFTEPMQIASMCAALDAVERATIVQSPRRFWKVHPCDSQPTMDRKTILDEARDRRSLMMSTSKSKPLTISGSTACSVTYTFLLIPSESL